MGRKNSKYICIFPPDLNPTSTISDLRKRAGRESAYTPYIYIPKSCNLQRIDSRCFLFKFKLILDTVN